MKELHKCEECVFYEDCKAFEGNYVCPAAQNFDIIINEIIESRTPEIDQVEKYIR